VQMSVFDLSVDSLINWSTDSFETIQLRHMLEMKTEGNYVPM
jgi:hypothetical protein